MEEAQKTVLARIAGGALHFDKPFARYTTIGIGGPAECVFEPSTRQRVESVLAFLTAESIPYLVVGRGSNLLVTDAGIRGVVVVMGAGMSGFTFAEGQDGVSVAAGAGLSISAMTARCGAEGFSGLEFLAWIPGTVGGAVAMNAGAFGFETAQRVREVHVVSPPGRHEVYDRAGLVFGYRHCDITPGAAIVTVLFHMKRVGAASVVGAVTRYGHMRRQSQPFGVRSAGSVFKNPPGHHAGALIEAAGLKGERRGGAVISEMHANFIVNTGGASAEDVLGLIDLARRRVRENSGIDLEPEIRIVGER